MPHHSFLKTLSTDEDLDDWLLSGSTLASRKVLQLLPPVPDRYGVFWNRRAVASNEFEVTFSMSVFASKRVPKDGVLAFWISPEDFASQYNESAILATSKEWSEGLKATGLTFIHNRPNFSGLALVFSGLNRKRKEGQSITALWGDGKRKMAIEDVVEGEGAHTVFRDWLADSTWLSIRVNKDGSILGSVMTVDARTYLTDTVWLWSHNGHSSAFVTFVHNGTFTLNEGHLSGFWTVLGGRRMRLDFPPLPSSTFHFEDAWSATQEDPVLVGSAQPKLKFVKSLNKSNAEETNNRWFDLFTLPAGTMPSDRKECFLGFTGWTGSNSSMEVHLQEVKVLNFDTGAVGEQDSDVLGRDTGAWLALLAQEYHFIDQASQTEAIARLTKLLTDHVESFDKLGEQLRGELVAMEARVDTLAQNISSYLHMAQAWVLERQEFDPAVVREHIASVHTILTRDRAAHDAKLSAVSDAAAALKENSDTVFSGPDGGGKIGAVAEQSKAVEELARSGSVQTNFLLLAMVTATALLGLLFLRRMRYYEKKHYL